MNLSVAASRQSAAKLQSKSIGGALPSYIEALWESQASFDAPEKIQCERMKKFMNYLGEGVAGGFLDRIRRSQTRGEFALICSEFLDHDQPMPLEPADARP
jgi:hypothetical protein